MSLPKGWVVVAASEACDLVQSGGTPRSGFQTVAGVPFLKVYNLVNQAIAFNYRPQFVTTEVHHGELGKSRALPGDVLMNIVGPPLGKVAIIPPTYPEWNLNQAITIFRPGAATSTCWLYWYLLGGDNVQSIINETRGSAGQVNISLSQCRAFEIPLPPAAEQRRIVAKLDALTARLARARAELDRTSKLASAFRSKALARCFAARVGVPSVALGTILTAIQSGKNMRCVERPPQAGERGVVKVSAVTWGRFNPEQSKTLPTDYVPPEVARIRAGDLLISRANTLELVGKPVLVEDDPRDLFLSDKILRLVMKQDKKKWVLWFLRSSEGRQQIEELSSGNQMSMRNIGQQAIRQIKIPLPDKSSRDRLLAMLEAAFARADRLEAEAARASALLDRLEAAILAKAFRGELVPQDPNDEPASVLLDRIRAERAAAPKAKRSRRPKEGMKA